MDPSRPAVNLPRLGIALFCLAVAFGLVSTAPDYSARVNLISELAAHNTRGAFIMAAAFVVLGAAISFDGWRGLRSSTLPFLLFGGFMLLAGLLGHKPMTPGVPYSAVVASEHSMFATAVGIAISLAFAWQAWLSTALHGRFMAAALALVCRALPLGMLSWPEDQGLIQRLMYGLEFGWPWVFYPQRIAG